MPTRRSRSAPLSAARSICSVTACSRNAAFFTCSACCGVDDGPHDASVSDWLVSLWIMLIGADRIDLLGGRGAFVLTPYLALTPIVVVSELISRHRRGRALTVPRGGLVYALVTAALVTVVLFSVMDALDVEISSSRALLLI